MTEPTDADLTSAIVKITNAYREGLVNALDALRITVTGAMAENLPSYDQHARSYSEGYLTALDNVEALLKVRAG